MTSVNAVPTLLLTAREAARLLAVCERTIANMVNRGELTPVRLNRAVRFDRRDLITLIDNKKDPGTRIACITQAAH